MGSQIRGQQGYTNKETSNFELWNEAYDTRMPGPDDDTKGLVHCGSGSYSRVPTGPRGAAYHGRERKRARGLFEPMERTVEKKDGETNELDYD